MTNTSKWIDNYHWCQVPRKKELATMKQRNTVLIYFKEQYQESLFEPISANPDLKEFKEAAS
jgi:hypothetical protein